MGKSDNYIFFNDITSPINKYVYTTYRSASSHFMGSLMRSF